MRFIATFCLWVFGAVAGAEPVRLENVRMWNAPDNTRVVFDVTSPVRHDIELLSNPFRVVVDLRDAQLSSRLTQPAAQDRFLKKIRAGKHQGFLRMVLELKKHATPRSFQLPPNSRYGHRLVIDIGADAAPARPPADIARPALFRDVVIAIDAGHGGEDPGAIGPKGTHEKTVVLQIAKRLEALVNQERGMRAVLIREGDYYLSLRKRIDLARRRKADLFVSIHADAFRNPKARGSSVYVLSRRGASSEHARWLAERENTADLVGGVSLDDKDNLLASVLLDLSQTASLEASIEAAEKVLRGMKKVGRVHKPRVESAAFAVLKSPDIPSILVETAFISNPAEEKQLRNAAHQRKIARAIFAGVRNYFVLRAPEGALLAARKHTIARGDTLSAIARRYGVSLQRLRVLNRLADDEIRTGQVLAIPSTSDG